MNRFEREIKESFSVPNPIKKEEFINKFPKPEMSLSKFVISQIPYVSKVTWALTILMFISVFLAPRILGVKVTWFISGLTPLMALLAVSESNRSQKYNMAQLEASTRFSLRSLLLARMLLLGIVSFVLIIVSVPLGTFYGSFRVFETSLYVITPFLLSASIGLYIVRSIKGNNGFYMVSAISLFISLIMFMGDKYFGFLFLSTGVKYWLMLFILLLVLTIVESKRLLNNTEDMTWSL